MKHFSMITVFLFLALFTSVPGYNNGNKMKNNISDITVKDMNGKDVHLSDYKGKVLLIVNVASQCGFTPQYEGLEKIYKKYNEKGFEILAFPCNQFGEQEPGTNQEIKNFCSSKYGVTFKLFDKIEVNGKNRSPLYKKLTENTNTKQGDIKWNFEKFLIAKDGEIIARFRSAVTPESKEITGAVEKELAR